MPSEQPERNPQIEHKEEIINCPKCGKPASRDIWTIGRLAMWWEKCSNCGYEKAPGNLLPPGKQN